MNINQDAISRQLNRLIKGMKKIEDQKLVIENDLTKFKENTTNRVKKLESVVVKFYNFVTQLNNILEDDDINKVKYTTELVDKMKSNKPFINTLQEVIQTDSHVHVEYEPNTLNTKSKNGTRKNSPYTSKSVMQKLSSINVGKAIQEINANI